MRLRVVSMLSVAVVVGGATLTFPAAATVGAQPGSGEWTRCAGNWHEPNDSGVSAQDYGPGHEDLDTFGAADVLLRSACTVGLVRIEGSRGNEPSTAITLTIYGDTDRTPNEADLRCTETFPARGPDYRVEFGTPCQLDPGRYWLVVQVHLDYGDGEQQWYWSLTDTARGYQGKWKNPGGGAATPCEDWGTIRQCVSSQGHDYLFKVKQRAT